MPERFAVAMIGAGQADLVAIHHLTAPGIEHVVPEHGRVCATRRNRWDSFILITPNWTVQLPGHLLRARPRWLHAAYGDPRLHRTLRSSCHGTSAVGIQDLGIEPTGEGWLRAASLSQAIQEN